MFRFSCVLFMIVALSDCSPLPAQCESANDCTAGKECNNGSCIDVACKAETDAALCFRFAYSCGRPTIVDLCGVVRTPVCGDSCATGGGGEGATGGGD